MSEVSGGYTIVACPRGCKSRLGFVVGKLGHECPQCSVRWASLDDWQKAHALRGCEHRDKAWSSVVIPTDAWGWRRPWICRTCGIRGSHFQPSADDYTREMVSRGLANRPTWVTEGMVEPIEEANRDPGPTHREEYRNDG